MKQLRNRAEVCSHVFDQGFAIRDGSSRFCEALKPKFFSLEFCPVRQAEWNSRGTDDAGRERSTNDGTIFESRCDRFFAAEVTDDSIVFSFLRRHACREFSCCAGFRAPADDCARND